MDSRQVSTTIHYEGVSEQGGAFIYRGQVQKYSDLPIKNVQVGDVYNVVEGDITHKINAGDNVVWNGTTWDVLAGTGDYLALSNKPKVNDIELSGNKSLSDLGIQPSGDYAVKSELPTKVSQLENDSEYLTQHQDISGKADKTYVDDNFVLISAYEAKIANLQAQIDNLKDAITKYHSIVGDEDEKLTLDTAVVGEPIISEQTLTSPKLEVVSDDKSNVVVI